MADTLYRHPRYYELLFGRRTSDLAFYLELADEVGGEVLELGVGTGRVALSLARAGHHVTGVELSEEMLETFASGLADEPAEVRARVDLHRGDLGELDLGRCYDLVLCPFNGIAHNHSLDELGGFLEVVTAHLAPGGTFAFDVLRPDPGLLTGDVAYVPWFRDPMHGEAARAEQTAVYDAVSQVLTLTTTVRALEKERAPVVLTLELRMLFPQETLLLLRHHGFRHVTQRTELGDVIGYVCTR